MATDSTGGGIIQYIRFKFDEASRALFEHETSDVIETAVEKSAPAAGDGAKKTAKSIIAQLKRSFEREMGDAREALAAGLIDRKEFEKRSRDAAQSLNKNILAEIKRLSDGGKLTDATFIKLTRTLKDVRVPAENVDKSESALERLRGTAVKLAAALGLVYLGHKLTEFLHSSVDAALESEKALARLAATLDSIGVNTEKAVPRIAEMTNALQKKTRFGDEAQIDAVSTLIQITGDYNRSVAALPVVLDFAAARQLDLSTATDLVGKAMIGHTETLARYGINVQKNVDIVDMLRDRFRGFAEKEVKTFSGALSVLNNMWDEFKEALGRALITSTGGTSIMESLTGTVITLTEWVSKHGPDFARWGDFIKDSFGIASDALEKFSAWQDKVAARAEKLRLIFSGADFFGDDMKRVNAEIDRANKQLDEIDARQRKRIDARTSHQTRDRAEAAAQDRESLGGMAARNEGAFDIGTGPLTQNEGAKVAPKVVGPQAKTFEELAKDRISLLKEATGATETYAEAVAGLKLMESGLLTQLNSTTDATKRQGLGSLLASTRDALKTAGQGPAAFDNTLGAGVSLLPPSLIIPSAQSIADELHTSFANINVADIVKDTPITSGTWFDDVMTSFLDSANDTADALVNVFGRAFAYLRQEGATAKNFLVGVFKAIGLAITGGVAKYASTKVAENIALAFEEHAKGIAATADPLLAPVAAFHFEAAREHGLTAVKWALLAGGAGAVGANSAGSGRGGAGDVGDARGTGNGTANDSHPVGPEIHIHVDGVNPRRPDHQDLIYETGQLALERWGGTIYAHAGDD